MTTNRLYLTWYDEVKRVCSAWRQPHRRNLTWLLVGIYLSRSVQLNRVAAKVPGPATLVSLTRRLSRFLEATGWVVRQTYDALISPLLAHVARTGAVHLIIDGSVVGLHHQLLMVSVAYRRRAVPVAWTWVPSHRGHSSTHVQLALLTHVRGLLPDAAQVDLVGDTEFGAIEVVRQAQAWGWQCAVREMPNYLVRTDAGSAWQAFATLAPQPGDSRWVAPAMLTAKYKYVIHLLAHWAKGEKDPWLIATTFPTARDTLRCYRRRAWTEELFGDLKGHGFDLAATHLDHLLKLSRLTLAVVLLYVWLVARGGQAIKHGQRYLVDRADRRDLSIFQIGLRFIERRLANDRPFRITFQLVT